MSLIKDFNDLHIGTKGIILNISSTVPFFFIVTYIFNPTLISKIQGNPLIDIDFFFVLSLCTVLSVLWFLMNFVLAYLVIEFIEWTEVSLEKNEQQTNELNQESFSVKEENNNDSRIANTFLITYISSIIYLAFAILLNMWVALSFMWFLISCFAFIFFRLVSVGVWFGIFKRYERKSNDSLNQ